MNWHFHCARRLAKCHFNSLNLAAFPSSSSSDVPVSLQFSESVGFLQEYLQEDWNRKNEHFYSSPFFSGFTKSIVFCIDRWKDLIK